METFEPPKYVASLIATINDGAKAAQAGSLAFILVALYLLATAFSTTDEDLLLQHATPVSQIGVQVPMIFSLAVAPAVFLILHVFTLIRYDMLAANLRQFRIELTAIPVEADHERCRHLLANVEFVQVLTAPSDSTLHSRLFGIVIWIVLAAFPVATLIIVQISSLREQSMPVTRTQQACLALDLLLLAWFAYRKTQREEPLQHSSVSTDTPKRARFRWRPRLKLSWRDLGRWALRCLVLPVIFVLDLWYIDYARLDVATVRSCDQGCQWTLAVITQPIDLALCPKTHWGCRYLNASHATIAGRGGSPKADAEQTASDDATKTKPAVEGAFLSERSLRFANFNDSRMYAIAMNQADLRWATLERANMAGADMTGANMEGADLGEANLTHATMVKVILPKANLAKVNLTKADLSGANLSGASFPNAVLTGADMSKANLALAVLTGQTATEMTGVHLANANLSGAYLNLARLTNADLTEATLTGAHLVSAIMVKATLTAAYMAGADLTAAQLNEAHLVRADLTNAILANAKLIHADLTNANLTGAQFVNADLSGADLQGAIVTQTQLDQACGTAAQLSTGLVLSHAVCRK
jgi:uncharacterized protein YjbI with pentapeptide repeats